MAWTERKLTEAFGVELTGQKLGPDLPLAERQAVYRAVTHHGVVILPGQDLSNDDIADFARSLGPTVILPHEIGKEPPVVDTLTNLDQDGNILPRDSMVNLASKANELWHIDSTYQWPRATVSMLYGKVIPPSGGNTEYCDMRRAWDALSPEEQGKLEGLTASHSIIHSRALSGFTDWPDEYRAMFRPIDRPLVRAHEETGRKALLTASHIEGLTGYSKDEAVALVADLIERATVPENCYSHRWSEGDFVMWDNRCVMHRARPYEIDTHPRVLSTIRLMDVAEMAPA
jgi:alpha-ketoglutarate-dependent 2,4-dichlorophenoxyacetate dioxygenase